MCILLKLDYAKFAFLIYFSFGGRAAPPLGKEGLKLVKVSKLVERKLLLYRYRDQNIGSGHLERLNILEILQTASLCVRISPSEVKVSQKHNFAVLLN